jgi:GT2 family glycosyltransferase
MKTIEVLSTNDEVRKQSARSPKVSVVVLNLNGYEDTRDCLESLRQVQYRNIETVVVDNGSSDDSSIRLQREFPELRVLSSKENLGFGGGSNLGIEDALRRNADYVLLLNNDTVVDPNFLLYLVEIGEADSRIGILGPKILYADDPKRIWFAGGFVRLRSGRYGHLGLNDLDEDGNFSHVAETGWITGCALLVKTSALREVGLLDSRLFAYSEDADFCMRMRRAGYRCVFVPRARVWHKLARTSGIQSPFYLYLGTRNQLTWVLRYVPFPYKLGALTFTLLKKIVKAGLLAFVRPESALAVCAGIRAFLLQKCGPPGEDMLPGRQLSSTAARIDAHD